MIFFYFVEILNVYSVIETFGTEYLIPKPALIVIYDQLSILPHSNSFNFNILAFL